MCEYCEIGANNKNMTSKKYSDVTVDIHKDEYVLSIDYCEPYGFESLYYYDYFNINYCPMCGRKLGGSNYE